MFKLCEGDMRRVVNMLQSLKMVGLNKIIHPIDVYNFTGNPPPETLQNYLNLLFHSKLKDALTTLEIELKENGISMQTFVKELYPLIMEIKMTESQKIYIVERLAEIEHRISLGCQERLALGALVGAFHQIRKTME